MFFEYGLLLVLLLSVQSYEATRTEDYWDSYSTGDIKAVTMYVCTSVTNFKRFSSLSFSFSLFCYPFLSFSLHFSLPLSFFLYLSFYLSLSLFHSLSPPSPISDIYLSLFQCHCFFYTFPSNQQT